MFWWWWWWWWCSLCRERHRCYAHGRPGQQFTIICRPTSTAGDKALYPDSLPGGRWLTSPRRHSALLTLVRCCSVGSIWTAASRCSTRHGRTNIRCIPLIGFGSRQPKLSDNCRAASDDDRCPLPRVAFTPTAREALPRLGRLTPKNRSTLLSSSL